jgi:hypothetical protein
MFMHQADNRQRRDRHVQLEFLEDRTVLSTTAVAAHLAVVASSNPNQEVSPVETKRELRQQEHLTQIAEHQQRIAEHRELVLERREAKLARIAAAAAARHHFNLVTPVQLSSATTNGAATAASTQTGGVNASSAGSTTFTPPTVTATTNGSVAPVSTTGASSSTTSPVGSPSSASPSPLPPNVASQLQTIYQEYENGTLPASTGQPGTVEIQGSSVGVEFHDSNPADFSAMVTQVENLGLQVTDVDSTYDTVTGFLPIAQLPAVAQLSTTVAVLPLLYPQLR